MQTKSTLTAEQLEIIEGLKQDQKQISSKFLYDDEGSRLFEKIMDLDEYYLTRTESEIFTQHGEKMAAVFSQNFSRYFNLIELGAGDGAKTKILLEALEKKHARYLYSPVDISGEALRILGENLQAAIPNLEINKLEGDYFNMLDTVAKLNHGPKVILFLGSSIGNYSNKQAVAFLKTIASVMSKEDQLMIGFDLVKSSKEILAAYNDSIGVTRAFNLNLLQRFNNELDANFDMNDFEHCPVYDPTRQAAVSYLVSKKDQNVYLKELDENIHFDAWETIHTESSQKYTLASITEIAQLSGLAPKERFYDPNKKFVDMCFNLAD